jgi:flagellar biosynthesis/type III secretory pathway M-ring protein FliF/YscJ
MIALPKQEAKVEARKIKTKMFIGQIISGITLVLIGLVILVAVVYTIKDNKRNKKKEILEAQQLERTLQLLRQPLSKTSALQFACSPPLSDRSELTECPQWKSFFQNRTVFFGS